MTRISGDTVICGVKAGDLRRLFKQDSFYPQEASATLRVPAGIDALLKALEAAGWVETSRSVPGAWSPTRKGCELSTVTFLPRIRRATGDKLVAKLTARLNVVNRQGFAFVVEEAFLFGSYLSDAPDLGDIDIAVRLRARHSAARRQSALEAERVRVAPRHRVSSEAKRDSWPEKEVLVFLRGGNPRLSIHSLEQLQHLPGVVTKRLL